MPSNELLFVALDTSSERLYGGIEEDIAQYCARQELLAAILNGQAHPDDLLDCLQDDLGPGAADKYLMIF